MDKHHPVKRAPAPWTLSAESYFLPLRLPSLPSNIYSPVEYSWSDETTGTFTGGLGAIMIVRYTSTPVGAYDELMLIPGNFTVPQPSPSPSCNKLPKIPKKALRIARIYVSQRTTMYNGRLNWNIPKHLARFEFSAPVTPAGARPPENLEVRVYAPGTVEGDGAKPFFACRVTPWKWVPGIPVDMRYVPLKMLHVQPPVPEAEGHKKALEAEVEGKVEVDEYDIHPKNEDAMAVGTEQWCSFDIGGKVGKARGCWVEMLEEDSKVEETERYWPTGVRPWSVGGWMERAVLEIADPIEWNL